MCQRSVLQMVAKDGHTVFECLVPGCRDGSRYKAASVAFFGSVLLARVLCSIYHNDGQQSVAPCSLWHAEWIDIRSVPAYTRGCHCT